MFLMERAVCYIALGPYMITKVGLLQLHAHWSIIPTLDLVAA